MNPHNYTLAIAIALLTLTTAPVLTSCANGKQLSPKAEAAVLKLKEAAQNIDVEGMPCGEFIQQLRELSDGAGKECREVLRRVIMKRGGV